MSILITVLALILPTSLIPAADGYQEPRYRQGRQTRDGIGKYYFGREISQVMGHRGAGWLERPQREQEEKPDLLLDSLNLESGSTVADIGAGSGYFSRRLAQRVGATGKVFAIDIQPEMIGILRADMESRGIENVLPVLGTETDPRLPEDSVDLALMVDVYHEFSHPFEMLTQITRALKVGGKLVFVEYRGEDRALPIKPLHKMTQRQVKKEMKPHPLVWMKTLDVLPSQHIMIFEKRLEAPEETASH